MNFFLGLAIGFILGALAMALGAIARETEPIPRSYRPIRRRGDRPPSPPQGGSGTVPKRAKKQVARRPYQRPREL